MKYWLSLTAAIILTGCSEVKVLDNSDRTIVGLSDISQDIKLYSKNVIDQTNYFPFQTVYEEIYFLPWSFKNAPYSLEEVLWPYQSYAKGKMYGENLKLINTEWFAKRKIYENYTQYDTAKIYALSKCFTHLRSFATNKPLFRDPNSAGEGFPFDYVQNSTVHSNEPLYISHYSQDKAWSYVFTSYASGWIPTKDIEIFPQEELQNYKNAQMAFVIKDNFPIVNKNSDYLVKGRIGALYPLIYKDEKNEEDSFDLLVLNQTNGKKYHSVLLSSQVVTKDKLKINSKNMEIVISSLIGQKYGWGGLYEDRDCSSTIRDIFTPFGIWLPRNSYQQSQIGKVIELNNMDDREKEEAIKEYGIPFETLLYKKGHILLYLGTKVNEITAEEDIIVLHNMWGLRTSSGDKYGRIVVGKTVITNLKIGTEEENFDQSTSLLKSLQSMNIITR